VVASKLISLHGNLNLFAKFYPALLLTAYDCCSFLVRSAVVKHLPLGGVSGLVGAHFAVRPQPLALACRSVISIERSRSDNLSVSGFFERLQVK
jgi:hypothetical protein